MPSGEDPLTGNPGRTEALSDAVFAIAMTLLVLDLRAPPHQVGRLLHGLLAQWPAYVSFCGSFLFIAVIWTNHRATFRQVDVVDRGVAWANLGILLGAVLLPFPTAVLAQAFRSGNHVDERTAVVLYAATAILMTTAWLVLFTVLHRRSRTIVGSVSLATWKTQMRRPIFGSLGYALGAGLGAVVHPIIGLIAFALVPIYYALTSEGLRASRPEATNSRTVAHPPGSPSSVTDGQR